VSKVYLSPSTQEGNIGKLNYGTEEAFCNLVVDAAQKILEAHGVTVFRNKPTMTLREVVEHSNNCNVDLHLAVHTNAFKGTQQGSLVMIHKKGGQAEKFANILYSRISALTPWADLGIRESYAWLEGGKPLYEPAYTHAPCALVEMDFHDNASSVQWLLDNIEALGRECAYAVLDYFGLIILSDADKMKLLIKENEGLRLDVEALRTDREKLEARITAKEQMAKDLLLI